jgi:hypothetical protein
MVHVERFLPWKGRYHPSTSCCQGVKLELVIWWLCVLPSPGQPSVVEPAPSWGHQCPQWSPRNFQQQLVLSSYLWTSARLLHQSVLIYLRSPRWLFTLWLWSSEKPSDSRESGWHSCLLRRSYKVPGCNCFEWTALPVLYSLCASFICLLVNVLMCSFNCWS